MENTSDNKSKFMALYWGQKVLYVGGVGICEIGKGGWNLKHPDFFLELKPLSSITDEDAIEVSRVLDSNFRQPLDVKYWPFHVNRGKSHILPTRPCRSDVADYLRSKGYALPYFNLSVEQQIEYNWIKLKTE